MQVTVESTISMHSMLMLVRLEACPQKNFEKGSSGLNLRVLQAHSHACYISYWTQLNAIAIVIVWWIWDMHYDIMLLYLLYLLYPWIMTSTKK